MSSRILRRFQGEEVKENVEGKSSDAEESLGSSHDGVVKRRNLPVNPFEVLNEPSESGRESKEDNFEAAETNVIRQRKKKKKKKKADKKVKNERVHDNGGSEKIRCDEISLGKCDFENNIEVFSNKHDLRNTPDSTEKLSSLLGKMQFYETSAGSIKLKYLNPNNELKKIFGSSVIRKRTRQRLGGRTQIKHLWLVNAKETWPPLTHSGISMKIERTNGSCVFWYEHDKDYQKTQKSFLGAIHSFSAEKIATVVKHHPYHVDALIQLSDIYKASEDLQTAVDLNERALYCLEHSFHPCFKMDRNCKLDYRRQQNRALFVSLFKHLIFVGERACYRTALELCKLLLSFDFDLDPLAVILCMDFYALRSRQYSWLISAATQWESKKNLSQLPNFAFSTALAHFYLSENDKSKLDVADKLLQDAIILFPGVLMQLLEKCSVQSDPMVCQHPFFTLHVELDHSPALMQLITLYVCRTYHEWKVPRVVAWLEKNVHRVLERLNTGDPYITECMKTRRTKYTSLPRNVLRHVILSDIKEVMTGIGIDSRMVIFTFDPVPPLDSIDIYTNNEIERNASQSQNLTSLFFRSLLPNFDVHNRPALPAENAVAEVGLVLEEEPGSLLVDTVRYGISILVAAVDAVVTDIVNRVEARMDGADTEDSESDSDDEDDSEDSDEDEIGDAKSEVDPDGGVMTNDQSGNA